MPLDELQPNQRMEVDAASNITLNLTQLSGVDYFLASILVKRTNVERVSPERTNVRKQDCPNFEPQVLGLIEDFKVSFSHHAREFVLGAGGCFDVLFEEDVLPQNLLLVLLLLMTLLLISIRV